MEQFFLKKSHNAEKTEREEPLGFFNIHSVAKLQKIEGGPFRGEIFLKKVAQCRKNLKGDLLVSSGIVSYAGNLFGSVSWANRYILGSSEFCRTFGRTILVSSGGLKKTLTKSHDYSRLFSLEKRRLKKLTSVSSNFATKKIALHVL